MVDMRPGLTAIPAAEHPINFNPDPNREMIFRVHHHTGDKWRPNAACRCNVHFAWLPLPAAVAGAIYPSRSGASKENMGIDRIDSKRPDGRQGVSEQLPMGATIRTHEQTGVSTGE
ncbi:MAG: hypothetical protein ETSY1_16555 [Candidatus Entotheonella factor]|uniref:Uncharacterized protein n=1 Tax=Entotheonella factor TaxID=1429438 RepID=W4LMT2_ENTF1|nr:MAG: hypothetical protein ETSY1_16555 [Candidatus Entotheonella factor]